VLLKQEHRAFLAHVLLPLHRTRWGAQELDLTYQLPEEGVAHRGAQPDSRRDTRPMPRACLTDSVPSHAELAPLTPCRACPIDARTKLSLIRTTVEFGLQGSISTSSSSQRSAAPTCATWNSSCRRAAIRNSAKRCCLTEWTAPLTFIQPTP
jgi:hypothetical protein